MTKQQPRPVAKVRAGKWPAAPRGTTYVEVTDAVTGATCIIELVHHFGSLKVQMHKPVGRVHLCSPVQCVWSSRNPIDMAQLERSEHYRLFGRYPDPVATPAAKECPDCGRCHDPDWGDTCAETEALIPDAAPIAQADYVAPEYLAYVAGWNARRRSRTNLDDDNPHPEGSDLATAWAKGFCRAAVAPKSAFLNPEKDGYTREKITAV